MRYACERGKSKQGQHSVEGEKCFYLVCGFCFDFGKCSLCARLPTLNPEDKSVKLKLES